MTRRLIHICMAAVLLVAACEPEARVPSPTVVSETTTTTVPATTTTTLSVGEATARFASCMTERGVPIGDVPLDSAGRPRLELTLTDVDFGDPDSITALSDCSELLTEGALDLTVWPDLRQKVQQALESFSECVRSHGVRGFPDPVRLFGGIGGPYPLEEIPFDDPDLDMAVEICSVRLAEGDQ